MTVVLDRIGALRRHPRWGPIATIVVGYVVLVEIGVQFLFGKIHVGPIEFGLGRSPIPHGIFVYGAVIGCLYSLVAIGIILVYRAARIINFAAAALGAVPAVIALVLLSRRGLPYLAAIPITLVGASLLGAATDTGVIRRFERSPRLILTVATIGVAQVLAFVEFYIPRWVGGTDLPPTEFPTPFSDITFNIGIVKFTGDHIVTVLVVAAIVVALGAFFRFTDMGIAVRASAENGERAQLLGIPVRRVSTVVWVLAAVLSGIGIFLRAPLVGLPIGGLIGPAVLLFGLTAAVIARMESLPTAFVAGVFVGIIDYSAVFSTRRPSLAYTYMLPIILIALLLQRGNLARAYEMGSSTWQAVKEFRPVPIELRALPSVIAVRVGLAAVVIALALGAPLLVGDTRIGLATLVIIYAMVGVSLVILTGWAGQISLGQFAFSGIGALVTGGLAARHDVDFFVSLLCGALVGALAAVLIGLPAVRIQGLFLAVTTLSFAFSVQYFFLNPRYFGWALPEDFQFVERPNLYGVLSVSSDFRFYYLCLAFLVLSLAIAASLRRNRSGRIFIGVRDNTRSMQAYGVNPARTRLAAFAVSGFIAAMAGGLLAYQQGSIDADAFSPLRSVDLFAMTVIGGLTSIVGALLGALYVIGIPYLLQDHIRNVSLLSTGAGLLVLLLFLPGGLAEVFYRTRDNLLRRLATKEGIHVPSLLADARVAEPTPTPATDASGFPDADTITCPVCHLAIPLDEARTHEHFASNGRQPAEEVTTRP